MYYFAVIANCDIYECKILKVDIDKEKLKAFIIYVLNGIKSKYHNHEIYNVNINALNNYTNENCFKDKDKDNYKPIVIILKSIDGNTIDIINKAIHFNIFCV